MSGERPFVSKFSSHIFIQVCLYNLNQLRRVSWVSLDLDLGVFARFELKLFCFKRLHASQLLHKLDHSQLGGLNGFNCLCILKNLVSIRLRTLLCFLLVCLDSLKNKDLC